jgi:hypothetical protein
MGRYDHCLTNSIWQRTSIEITDTQVANNLKNIANFYHFDGCDEWKVLYEQQFPILVAFREGDGNDGPLHIAVLNRKPFQAPVKYIKTAKPEDPKKLFRFACKKILGVLILVYCKLKNQIIIIPHIRTIPIQKVII